MPDNGMFKLGLDASEMTAMLPLKPPAAAGVNFAVKEELCPALSVSGSVNPLMEKDAPVRLACVMVTGEPPVLLRVSTRLALLPT